MKKLVILPALALLLTVGVFTLGQQSKSAHAATRQTVVQKNTQASVNNEKPDTPNTNINVTGGKVSGQETPDATGAAENENDGPGGHQDPQGANVNHQVDGAE